MRSLAFLAVIGLAWGGVPNSADAQRAARRVVTLDMLTEHTRFFHLQEVIIHAEMVGENVLTYLVDQENRLLVLDVAPPLEGTRERVEVIGRFYDSGRLQPDDPRTTDLPIERLSRSLLNKPWPAVGELPLVVATSSVPVTTTATATLRTVALAPGAYLDEGVSLTGRFRGRNLYGDLPDSPRESRYDFVLASADAAVWVVGMEPKGDGFELDVQARRDTGRWLEVTGTVRTHEGMVVLDAGTIRLAEPIENQPRPVTGATRRRGPPPEVIFTTPFEGDTNIPTDTRVRIQFSRDMSADSFEGRVEVAYSGVGSAAATGQAGESAIEFDIEYRGRNRVLDIQFAEPLETFSPLTVTLLDGITSRDGVPLPPWSLSFFSGP